jgi:hypothetical protein
MMITMQSRVLSANGVSTMKRRPGWYLDIAPARLRGAFLCAVGWAIGLAWHVLRRLRRDASAARPLRLADREQHDRPPGQLDEREAAPTRGGPQPTHDDFDVRLCPPHPAPVKLGLVVGAPAAAVVDQSQAPEDPRELRPDTAGDRPCRRGNAAGLTRGQRAGVAKSSRDAPATAAQRGRGGKRKVPAPTRRRPGAALALVT